MYLINDVFLRKNQLNQSCYLVSQFDVVSSVEGTLKNRILLPIFFEGASNAWKKKVLSINVRFLPRPPLL